MEEIQLKFQSEVDQCLMAMLSLWLKQSYDTEKYGRPSWEQLGIAVSHRCGGNDVVLSSELDSWDFDYLP